MKNLKMKLGIVMAAMITIAATAQILNYRAEEFPNMATTLAAQTGVSPTNAVITIRKDRGIALFPTFTASEEDGEGNVLFRFAPSYDGTNFSTVTIDYTLANNGTTNAVIGYTNIPPAVLNNVQHLMLLQITNASTNVLADITVTASWYYPSQNQ